MTVRRRTLAVAKPQTPAQRKAALAKAKAAKTLATQKTAKTLPLHQAAYPAAMAPGSALGNAALGASALGMPAAAGYPVEAGLPGSLSALDRAKPQVNATNQSALANNGTVNQTVTNNNTYNNSYNAESTSTYPGYGYGSPIYGGGLAPYFDPCYAQMNKGGILGWLQRLFRGY